MEFQFSPANKIVTPSVIFQVDFLHNKKALLIFN